MPFTKAHVLCVLEEEDVLWPGTLEDTQRDWWEGVFFLVFLVSVFHGLAQGPLSNIIVPDALLALLVFLAGHF